MNINLKWEGSGKTLGRGTCEAGREGEMKGEGDDRGEKGKLQGRPSVGGKGG